MNYADLLLPEPGQYINEKQLADTVLGELRPHFHIQREVSGLYPTGKALRLDAVLRPRDPGPWFDDEPVFGVEFKLPSRANGYRDDAAQIRQAADYTYCEFDGYGRLGIFLCPSPVLGKLQSAQDVMTRHTNRVAEEGTIEYHRKWVASFWRASGHVFTDAELDAEARTARWKARKRLEAIEAGARAEGFSSATHREQHRLLDQAGFLVRMMGGFGVGELMLHRTFGWTLLRSGDRLWSQLGEPVRRPTSLRPRLGSQ
ncbi:hypothetical protein ACMATS_17980 [Streptoverticillium reticulum]|uniref:hypothetical protein n=1 Tax=Streptomyces TaxID=1883 RepID=UPI003681919F